jgi:soluble lytic murein transglycosylase-like protein
MLSRTLGILFAVVAMVPFHNTLAHSETALEVLMKQTQREVVAAEAAKAKPRAGQRRTSLKRISRTVSQGSSDGGSVAAIVRREAARQGLPASFAIAVARTESGLRCRAVGRHGELGPFQIKPATARGIGYRGSASALNSCGAGITWGIRHLMIGYRKCGSTSGAAALHNGGLGASCRATKYTRLVASRF